MSDGNRVTPEWVWMDGRFLPAEAALVPVMDRGLLYGDGLFESMRVYAGRPFRWDAHWQRLAAGAGFLGIRLPWSGVEVRAAADELIARNERPESALRVTLTRGVGPRGYSTTGAHTPRLILTLHPALAPGGGKPEGWRMVTSRHRLVAGDALAPYKHSCRLLQVLARREAEEAGADEALLLNTDGHVAEAASANLFWIEGDTLHTPDRECGGLVGVTREFVLKLAPAAGLATAETRAPVARLHTADGVFLTTSGLEIVPVQSLDGRPLPRSPKIAPLQAAYRAATAGGA